MSGNSGGGDPAQVQSGTWAGNLPSGATLLSPDQYSQGLQTRINYFTGKSDVGSVQRLQQDQSALSDYNSKSGVHASGYVDPSMSKYQANAPTPSEDYYTPEYKASLETAKVGQTPVSLPNGTTGYVPNGSAGANLSQGLQNGTVSGTNPGQQYDASLTGNTQNQPGVNPLTPNTTPINATGQGLGYNDLKNSQIDPTTGQPMTPAQLAFAATQATSTPAPQDSATGTSVASAAIKKNTPTDNSAQIANVQNTLDNDPGYQQLLTDANAAKQTQGATLLDTYKQMIKDSGVAGIDSQLINDQAIINGTEDDIRKEVQSAGGFATDSQVMALSAARNKTLIQSYNQLLATKTAAMDQINTMIGLAGQDKQIAQQQANNALNIDQQLLDYQTKMQSAAQEGYNTIVKAAGYDGLLASLNNDPASIALAEKTLGLQPGGLQSLVNVQQAAANTATAQAAGVSTQFANQNGTFFNAKTGQAYPTPQDFFKAAGVSSFADAYAKGLVTDLGGQSNLKSSDTQIVTANGRTELVNKITGEVISDLGSAYKGDTPSPDDSQKTVDAFNKTVATWDKKGTREQFVRELQAQYPDIDPSDIDRKVGEVYPNGYDS